MGLPWWQAVRNLPWNARDTGAIPGQGAVIPQAAEQPSPRIITRELVLWPKDPTWCNKDPTQPNKYFENHKKFFRDLGNILAGYLRNNCLWLKVSPVTYWFHSRCKAPSTIKCTKGFLFQNTKTDIKNLLSQWLSTELCPEASFLSFIHWTSMLLGSYPMDRYDGWADISSFEACQHAFSPWEEWIKHFFFFFFFLRMGDGLLLLDPVRWVFSPSPSQEWGCDPSQAN